MPRSRHSDSRYTDLFSHPAFVSSLVEHFVHEDFVRELDFSTLKPYKTKLVTRRYLRREYDVIWSVRFRDRTIYLFFLLEFQSSVDHRMPVRLLQIEERSFAPAVLEAMGVLAKPLRGRLRERNLPRKGLIAPASVPG